MNKLETMDERLNNSENSSFNTFLYSILTVSVPFFAVYDSFIPNVDLGTMIAVIIGLYLLLFTGGRIRVQKSSFGIFLLYVVFDTIIMAGLGVSVAYSPSFSIFMRTARFVVLISIVLFFYGNLYDTISVLKTYRFFAYIVIVFTFIQFISYNFFGHVVINIFNKAQTAVVLTSHYRPPSVFNEPSSIAYYLIPFICLNLFGGANGTRNGIKDAILATAAILLSTSSQGVICCFFVWLCYLYVTGLIKKQKKILLLIPVFVLIVGYLIETEGIQFALSRIYGDGYNAVDARAPGYYEFSILPTVCKIFGCGFGNYKPGLYYSSFSELLCCTGIVGTFYIVALYISYFLSKSTFNKVLVVSLLFLMLGGGVFTASYLCLCLPLLISHKETSYD